MTTSLKSDEMVYCNSLVQAIDFFTQSLHMEQLSQYGYELVHEMLNLKRSALFLREGSDYVLKSTKGYPYGEYCIQGTQKLYSVATLFGRIMTHEQAHYFTPKDLDAFSVALVIPLILKDQLVGFILSDGLLSGSLEGHRMQIAASVMQLMNRAVENAKNFLDLEKKNFELDKKIFNLFFINHCSRTLLSELNLERIYEIGIDIIRELTASSVTSFGVYDPTRDRILLKGYQDILTFQPNYAELQLRSGVSAPDKLVYHVDRDQEILQNLFVNPEEFLKLKAEYVIILAKEHILGFVTISESVSGRPYDDSLFELIDTISTAIYISITNARQFETIQTQNQLIQAKFETLQKLNVIARNINACESRDELCTIAMQSLEIGYGVKKGFIALYEDDGLQVVKEIQLPHLKGRGVLLGEGIHLLDDRISWHEYTIDRLSEFFPEFEEERHQDANCMVVSAIRINRMALENNGVLGYLVVFETEEPLRDESILLIESLSNSMAPILFQMRETERIQEQFVEDPRKALVCKVEEALQNRTEFFIDFKVWYKYLPHKPLEPVCLDPFIHYPVFWIDSYVFSLLTEDPETNIFDGFMIIEDLEDFFQQAKML